jgi:hypothetical protein
MGDNSFFRRDLLKASMAFAAEALFPASLKAARPEPIRQDPEVRRRVYRSHKLRIGERTLHEERLELASRVYHEGTSFRFPTVQATPGSLQPLSTGHRLEACVLRSRLLFPVCDFQESTRNSTHSAIRTVTGTASVPVPDQTIAVSQLVVAISEVNLKKQGTMIPRMHRLTHRRLRAN